jgi:hypothetical protein
MALSLDRCSLDPATGGVKRRGRRWNGGGAPRANQGRPARIPQRSGQSTFGAAARTPGGTASAYFSKFSRNIPASIRACSS